MRRCRSTRVSKGSATRTRCMPASHGGPSRGAGGEARAPVTIRRVSSPSSDCSGRPVDATALSPANAPPCTPAPSVGLRPMAAGAAWGARPSSSGHHDSQLATPSTDSWPGRIGAAVAYQIHIPPRGEVIPLASTPIRWADSGPRLNPSSSGMPKRCSPKCRVRIRPGSSSHASTVLPM